MATARGVTVIWSCYILVMLSDQFMAGPSINIHTSTNNIDEYRCTFRLLWKQLRTRHTLLMVAVCMHQGLYH